MKLMMIKKIVAATILGGGAIVTATALGAWNNTPNPYTNLTTSKSKNELKNDSEYINPDFKKATTTLPTYYGPQHKLITVSTVKLVKDDADPDNSSILVQTNVGLFYKRENKKSFEYMNDSQKFSKSYLSVQKSGWIVAHGDFWSIIPPTFAESMNVYGMPSGTEIRDFKCSNGYLLVSTDMGIYSNKTQNYFYMEKYENIDITEDRIGEKVYCQLPSNWYSSPIFYVYIDIFAGNYEYAQVYRIDPSSHEANLAPGVPSSPLIIWKILFSTYNVYIAAGYGHGTGSYVYVSNRENVNFYKASGIAGNGYATRGLAVDDTNHVAYASVDPADGRISAGGIYYADDTSSRVSFKKSLGIKFSLSSSYASFMAVTSTGRVFVRDADNDPTIEGIYYSDSNGQYFTKIPNLQREDIYNELIPDSMGYAFFKSYGYIHDISALKPNLSYEKIYVSGSTIDAWAEYGQWVKNKIRISIYIVENNKLYIITNILDLIPLIPSKIHPSTLAPAKEYTYEGYAKTTKIFLWTNVYLGINGETRLHLYDYIKLQKENHVNDSVIEANILKKQWKKDNKGFKYSGDIWNVGIDELVHRDWGNWTRGDGKTPIEVHFTTDDLTPLISGYPRWSLTFKGYNYAYNPN